MPSAARARVPNGEPGWEQEHLLQIPWKMGLDIPNAAVRGKAPARQCQGSSIPVRREALPVPVLLLDLDHEHQGTSLFQVSFFRVPKAFLLWKTFPEPAQIHEENENQISYTCREGGGDQLPGLNTGSHLEFSGIRSGFGTKPRKAGGNSALNVPPALLRQQIPLQLGAPRSNCWDGQQSREGCKAGASLQLHPCHSNSCSIAAAPSL